MESIEIRKRLTDADTAQKDHIIAQHQSDVRELERKAKNAVESQNDKLAAKLAARKRLRDELEVERAIQDEMTRIAIAQSQKGNAEAAEAVLELKDKIAAQQMDEEATRLQDKQVSGSASGSFH